MVTGKIINREASERSTYGTHTVFVNVGQVGCRIVDGCKIVAHALTRPVAADLLAPLAAEAGQTVAVGCNDYIAVSSHNHEVPTIAPELADGALRTTFTEEQCRIFLRLVEVRRQDNPVVQVFARARLGPSRLNGASLQLVEDVLVLTCNLLTCGLLR